MGREPGEETASAGESWPGLRDLLLLGGFIGGAVALYAPALSLGWLSDDYVLSAEGSAFPRSPPPGAVALACSSGTAGGSESAEGQSPKPAPSTIQRAARQRASRLLVVDRDRPAEVEEVALGDRLFESGDWLVLRFAAEHSADGRR